MQEVKKVLEALEELDKIDKGIKLESKKKHSREFLRIMESKDSEKAIKAITHSKPVLVFWISEKGDVIDAKEAHHTNPPYGDKSVLADKINKGYLRGRVAYIGDVLYIVIYGDENGELSRRQLYQFRRHYPKLLRYLKEVKVSEEELSKALFITENGTVII